MIYQIYYTKQALKDLEKIKEKNLAKKVIELQKILQNDPFILPYEKLVGNLQGFYSRRINIQHRLVYQILEKEKSIKIIRMWSHYD